MVTMVINFDLEKLKMEQLTVESILNRFNDYCYSCRITRPEVNVFEKNGEHAIADLSKITFAIEKDKTILDLIKEWYWIIDGEREDILAEAYYWRIKQAQ